MALSFLNNGFIIARFVKIREIGIRLGGGVDFGEINSLGIWSKGFVNLATTDDKNLFVGVFVFGNEFI